MFILVASVGVIGVATAIASLAIAHLNRLRPIAFAMAAGAPAGVVAWETRSAGASALQAAVAASLAAAIMLTACAYLPISQSLFPIAGDTIGLAAGAAMSAVAVGVVSTPTLAEAHLSLLAVMWIVTAEFEARAWRRCAPVGFLIALCQLFVFALALARLAAPLTALITTGVLSAVRTISVAARARWL